MLQQVPFYAVCLIACCLLQAGDEKTASAVSKGLSRKRKQLAQPLRCELIAGVHKPAGSVSAQSGPKARGKLVLPHQRKQPQVQLQQKHQGKGVYKLPASSTFDLWDEQPDTTDPRLDRYNNIPGAINGTADQPSKRRKQAVKLATKAVVVDAAGCSYNPDIEHHQEALSQAVAAEMQKVYKHDMQPRSVPRFVDYQPETDELALLQVDAEPDSDEDGVRLHTAAAPAAAFSTRIKQTKRDQASRMRHRLQEVEERTRRALKTQRRDIDNLRQLQLQVQAEEAVRYCCCVSRSIDLFVLMQFIHCPWYTSQAAVLSMYLHYAAQRLCAYDVLLSSRSNFGSYRMGALAQCNCSSVMRHT